MVGFLTVPRTELPALILGALHCNGSYERQNGGTLCTYSTQLNSSLLKHLRMP